MAKTMQASLEFKRKAWPRLMLKRRRRAAAAWMLSTLLAAGPLLASSAPRTAAHASHAEGRRPEAAPPPAPPLTPTEQAAQVLDRLSFGPRPGEVEQVARMGWESWFEQQLDPGAIPDPVASKRLGQYPALQLPPQQLSIEYPDGQVIRRVAEGKASMPSDPQLAGVYEVLLARYRRKQAEDKADAAGGLLNNLPGIPGTGPGPGPGIAPGSAPGIAPKTAPSAGAQGGQATRGMSLSEVPAEQARTAAALPPAQLEAQKSARRQQQKEQEREQARVLADQILGDAKNQRMQAIFALPVEGRMVLTSGIAEPEKSQLLNDLTPHERELFGMMAGGYGGSGVIANEMQQAKVVRAVLSERQLQEVMTDFWWNHFNVDLAKSGDMLNYAPSYERDAIRSHALGKFRDLLLATAEHPAMLIYLDNWLSIGPDSRAAGRPRPNAKNQQPRGLNENYGREVMELHTVGVDAGYTQADVTNLAKILTGWTIDKPQTGGNATFDPARHEPGTKPWFGQQVKEDGMNEGVRALSRVAAMPQTAHFISYKLAQRFVADAPPPALVDRMAAAYLSSDGDIKTVLRTMVHSPEFFARGNYRTKVKMPLEYVASSLRATGTDPSNPGALVNELKTMGEPLYRCLPPTGYPATADHWMNSSALVDRLNFAIELTGSKLGGMHFDASRLLAAGLLSRPSQPPPAVGAARPVALRSREDQPTPSGEDEALLLMERLLVPGLVSEKTNAVIRQQLAPPTGPSQKPGTAPEQLLPMSDPSETLDKLAAMILGSPEFQVH